MSALEKMIRARDERYTSADVLERTKRPRCERRVCTRCNLSASTNTANQESDYPLLGDSTLLQARPALEVDQPCPSCGGRVVSITW